MAIDIDRVDPQWAWSPYSAEKQRPWNRAMASHLFRRAGFGANESQLQDAVKQGAQATVDSFFDLNDTGGAFQTDSDDLTRAMINTGEPRRLAAAWLHRMLGTPHQLLEKMTLFWHGHFATGAEKVKDAGMMWDQNQLFRRFALGDFGQLVQEISRDPAMLIYLDSTTNRKAHPNENYAREVMELFCLGEGNYTEKDVQQLARCFTGWELRRKKFRFNRYQHDGGSKTILGQTGEFRGEDGVRIVLGQPSAAQFIVTKLLRFFVFDEPTPPTALVEPLAKQLRENEFHVGPVVRRILGSQLFFSPHALARKIRSPVELAVGFLRSLEGSTNLFELVEQLEPLGQALFYPPNVKGWDGGRTWVNSSTLLARANLIGNLVNHPKTRFRGGDLAAVIDPDALATAHEVVDRIASLVIAVPVPRKVRDRLIRTLDGSIDNESLAATIHAMSVLPEFQLA